MFVFRESCDQIGLFTSSLSSCVSDDRRDRDRDRDHDRNRDRNRDHGDRRRDSDRRSERDRREREWEETPSQRARSNEPYSTPLLGKGVDNSSITAICGLLVKKCKDSP